MKKKMRVKLWHRKPLNIELINKYKVWLDIVVNAGSGEVSGLLVSDHDQLLAGSSSFTSFFLVGTES